MVNACTITSIVVCGKDVQRVESVRILYLSFILLNPFQSNFSANRILPSSNLFWAGKRLVDYL